ncbi:MAG: hypothetical protein Q9165_007904 [Trypethelium subeluteriae]
MDFRRTINGFAITLGGGGTGKLEKATKEKANILRDSLTLTPAESGNISSHPDEVTYSCIVVGFIHLKIPPDREKRNVNQTKQKATGLLRPKDEDIIVYDPGAAKLPLVVVYELDPNQTDETDIQSQQTSKKMVKGDMEDEDEDEDIELKEEINNDDGEEEGVELKL